MQAEDRPIHFSTELIYDKREIDKQAVQDLYFNLTQSRGLDYDNSQIGKMPLGRFYTERGEKSKSMIVLLKDRVGILEEWVDLPLSEYIDKVTAVSEQMMEQFDIEEYRAQSVIMRTTFGLSHFDDSRKFIFDQVCAQAGNILPHFKRPISSGGLRFVLPATPEHNGTFHISIEPFTNSPREVFVEVKGVFASQHTSLLNSGDLEGNIRQVREFILENVFPFLNQYDIQHTDD